MERKLIVMVALLGLCLLAPNAVLAQGSDNFDSYTAGAVIPAGNGWVGWGGAAAMNGIVTAGPANSQPNSLAVVGGAGTDQVLEFGYGPKTGQWFFSAMTYVPSAGKAGEQYFNLQNKFDQVNTPNVFQWSNVEVHWMMTNDDANQADTVYLGSMADGRLPIQYDAWVEVSADIDLDANSVEVFYGGTSLGATTWSKGAEAVHGIDVMDIFPISNDASVMYYDDISLTPEPATLAMLGVGGLMMLRRRRRKA